MSDINNLPKAEGKEEIKKDASHSDNVLEENKSVETNHSETKDTPSVSEEKTIDNNESASGDTKNSDKQNDEVLNEIEDSNAEDAEDEGNKDRHTIEVKAYDTMSLEALAIELERLVKNEKVQAIKSHVDGINSEFKDKFQALLDEKKEEKRWW